MTDSRVFGVTQSQSGRGLSPVPDCGREIDSPQQTVHEAVIETEGFQDEWTPMKVKLGLSATKSRRQFFGVHIRYRQKGRTMNVKYYDILLDGFHDDFNK